MPRVRRRGFQRLYSYGLSFTQSEILLYGPPLSDVLPGDGPGFASEDAERAAWFANRDELMQERLGPGRRPYAYFKWELQAEPRRWWDEVRLLLENDLLDEPEVADIERQHRMLASDPQCQYYASFDSEGTVKRLLTTGPPLTLLSHANLFDFAASWHAWRGREALADRYKARADVVRRVAAELRGRCEVDASEALAGPKPP